MADFKLTYATMFNPPEELHTGFNKAVEKLKKNMGQEYGMLINGKEVMADDKLDDHSPVNTDWVLAKMQKGNAKHAQEALSAARKAFPMWSRTPWQKRVELLRKAASLIEERIFDLGAAMALEVGKNRMGLWAMCRRLPISFIIPAIKWKRTKVTLLKWEKIRSLDMRHAMCLCFVRMECGLSFLHSTSLTH
jgi:hypothetical protein